MVPGRDVKHKWWVISPLISHKTGVKVLITFYRPCDAAWDKTHYFPRHELGILSQIQIGILFSQNSFSLLCVAQQVYQRTPVAVVLA